MIFRKRVTGISFLRGPNYVSRAGNVRVHHAVASTAPAA